MSASYSASKCPDLARKNADWYAARCLRLIDTFGDAGSHRCSMTRCCSGFKVHRAKAELHVLARGIRNKAARGELRCGLPVGFEWGGGRYHPRASLALRLTGDLHSRLAQKARVAACQGGEIEAIMSGADTRKACDSS
jgi:hypothetical protein